METTKMVDQKLGPEERLRVLLYGPAGSGKTTLAGTFPKPMLIFDFDGKVKPLYGIEGIEVVSYFVDNPKDGANVWRRFMKDFREAKSDPKWKTLVFDSLSSMDTILLLHVVVLDGKGAEDRPQIQHYGEHGDLIKWFFGELKSLDKNIIVTAHHAEIRDEDVILEITPLLTGTKIKSRIPALFEEVWFLERKGGDADERVLHFRPWKKVIATSTILRGDAISNPTYDLIWKSIIGGKNG